MYICLTVKQFNFYQFFNSFELFKVFNFGFKIISIGSQCTVQNILKVGTLVLFFSAPKFWPMAPVFCWAWAIWPHKISF